MEKISLKTKIVRIDGWRSRLEPINAICGANDTGSYSDSPCPTSVALEELNRVKIILRKNGIQFRSMILNTSNVFCIARYIVIHESNKERAIELIRHLIPETRLLYIYND
jgi:hypothetical protein